MGRPLFAGAQKKRQKEDEFVCSESHSMRVKIALRQTSALGQ
jgi:hypothetical protein